MKRNINVKDQNELSAERINRYDDMVRQEYETKHMSAKQIATQKMTELIRDTNGSQ